MTAILTACSILANASEQPVSSGSSPSIAPIKTNSGLQLEAPNAERNIRGDSNAPPAGPESAVATPRTRSSRSTASSPRTTTHERFATFVADEDFKSTLVLENFRQDVPITVRPSLILTEGEVALDPITLSPHTTATVDINAFLKSHGHTDRRGTVSIRYDFASYGPLTAVVQSADYSHRLYLNSFAQSPEDYWSGTAFDAVIWAPDSGTHGVISITNTSSESRVVHTTVFVSNKSEELAPIEIPSRKTRTIAIDDLISRSKETGAGIHLGFDEYPGDILVEGQLFNKRTGFAKYIHFADRALQYPTATLRTHFLLLGSQPAEDGFPSQVSFRSVAAVRNIDNAPVHVTPTVLYTENGSVKTITLPALALGSGEPGIVDLAREQTAGRLPQDLHQASLQLVPDNENGSIVAELFNFDGSTGGYVVGPTFSSYPNRGTASIWRTDGTFQTTVMVENTAQQSDEVSLKLFSDSGTYTKIFPISAGSFLKINLKELQQNAIGDKDGHLLSGTAGILSIAGSRNAQSKLTFDKIIHSADEADYVGLPPNSCDFVIGISLSIDLSGGQNPFPVIATWDWSQSGAQDQAASGSSSSNSSMVSIVETSSGDFATLTPSTDGTSQLVDLSGPEVGATSCEACSAGNFSQTGSVTVEPCDFSIVPDAITSGDCTTGTEQHQNFSARVTPGLSQCSYASTGSSCSATASGNVELDTTTPVSPNFAVTPNCKANYFSGPKRSDGSAGTINMSFTVKLQNRPISHTQAVTVACP